MPKQISKTLSIQLFDEEVVAWDALLNHALKKKLAIALRPGLSTISSARILREILRLAAEHVATDIGPGVAASLAAPRPYVRTGQGAGLVPRSNRNESVSQALKMKRAKSTGRNPKSVEKPAVKSKVRVFWDRPWIRPGGGT